MADRTFDVKSSSVKRLCHFVIATAYNKQIPQICHWLIDQEQNPLTRERESHYKIRLTKLLENGSDKNSSEYDLMPCCHTDDLMYPGHASASNITLVLILSAIFIILLFSAIITCTKRRKQSQTEIDEETESVRNMRILASLTRLSRVHVVSLQPHEHDFLDLRDFHNQNPEIFQPPPDYEMAQEIRKKEEEELPSYSQAVSNSTTNHM